ncbi:hypothetical protein TRV_02773 [Trichophyton verrucosum HKI 0517]|uniref:AT hook motif family protein n=1 Tax=Trichophyton verrucosum (strain HKI 0517) TaxID=663202 RepID=D4D6P6_TRIVH|nr:uncharacterized protein TRV_02773 [Trichophyton verrucosum HKI 0517]EFE42465.1 hypothetical protein TRV_02773 [Trichophyton verrucosum HKI 0517]
MRNLRSGTAKAVVESEPCKTLGLAGLECRAPDSLRQCNVLKVIPTGSRLPDLTASEQKLLRQKQRRLAADKASLDREARECLGGGNLYAHNGLQATLIFSQYEAGTAVCIGSDGWALTCAHCFGDTEEELQTSDKRRWLLFCTGLAVQAECVAWDARRDLALLKIVAIEADASRNGEDIVCSFPFVQLAPKRPAVNSPIICIGQPGVDDLESSAPTKNKFDFVELSTGKFRGMVAGGDWQDNSEIGQMKHDAWTYWGHSGAPLLAEADGSLIGLHSSWDDQTGMRHGIPLVAIQAFLAQHAGLMSSMGQAAKAQDDHTLSKLAVEEEVIVISD